MIKPESLVSIRHAEGSNSLGAQFVVWLSLDGSEVFCVSHARVGT